MPTPIASSKRRFAHPATLALLAGWAASGAGPGCCQYPCYPPSGCPPIASAQPSGVRYGSVCDAPSTSSPSIVATVPTPSRSSTSSSIADAPRPRIVSEPSGRLAGRSGWRKSEPENYTTRADGDIDDSRIR